MNNKYLSRFKIQLCAAALLLVTATGCKSTPVVDSEAPMSADAPIAVVEGGQRKNTTGSVKSIAARIDESADNNRSDNNNFDNNSSDAMLQRHLRAIAANGKARLIAHNDVKLLIDGPQAYNAMFTAMEYAHSNINLEVYIFQDDKIGQDLRNILLKKRSQGVSIKLIYDSLGSLSTSKEFFQPLKDAGVQIMEFNPVNPVEGKTLDINNRDHRKLLIVDGVVGFTGGINISSVYSHGSSAQRAEPDSSELRKEGWRDTQIEVHGPAVAELQKIFFQTWNSQGDESTKVEMGGSKDDSSGKNNKASGYYPSLYGNGEKSHGDKFVKVIASSPNYSRNDIYVDLLTAIQQSKRSVHLTMAYFSPDSQMITALKDAAKRGVDVTLVLPGFSDIWLIFESGRSYYSELLKAGVKIYERHDAFLHAKTAVIDGVWSTVGSSNMDMRSFLHNNEVNVIVLGSDFGDEMEVMFRRDVAEGTFITQQMWRRRPLLDRFRQVFARIWSYWL